ncbi:MAG: FAD-dependent oxidoreductase [Solobacterium sp.]|nr:FAD-dependent oxidoreductase [Solobacterium sp.]
MSFEGKKIAMVGAGPANLNAAKVLIAEGFTVDIYEKEAEAGGAVYTGIPAFRMPHAFIEKLAKELADAGVGFHMNTEIGKDISFEELLEKYDRVLLGIGAQVENKFGMEGDGYIAGLTLLYDLNVLKKHEEYKEKYHKAVVWGGGNVAMDCSASLARILPDVRIIYRRSEAEMPASKKEIKDNMAVGVKFEYLENIKDLILDENGKVKGVHIAKMELGEPDSSGRRRPVEIPGSIYEFECDLVVPAIGQYVDFSAFKGVEKGGTHLSTVPNVYITGDAYLGPKNLGAAVKDGKEAAQEIIDSFR